MVLMWADDYDAGRSNMSNNSPLSGLSIVYADSMNIDALVSPTKMSFHAITCNCKRLVTTFFLSESVSQEKQRLIKNEYD